MQPPRKITTLPKEAIHVDSIENISDPLSSMSSVFSLIYLLTLAYQVRTPVPAAQERLLTLLNTMSPVLRPGNDDKNASDSSSISSSSTSSSGYSRGEILNSFVHFLSPVLNGMAGMLELLSAVDAFSRPQDFRDFWSLEQSNLIRDFIESGGPLRGMEGYDVPFLESFVQDPSCRIALGKDKGMLLLVPGDAEVGDDVWWDQRDERLSVTRARNLIVTDGLKNEDETYLNGGSWRAVMEISSAT